MVKLETTNWKLLTESCQTDPGVPQSREIRERGGLFRAALCSGTGEEPLMNPYNP